MFSGLMKTHIMLAGDVLLSFLCDHYFCDDDHFMNETLIIKFIILREVLV